MLDPQAGECFADGTLGGGGHTTQIIERIGSGGTFLGTDRDQAAVDRFTETFGNRPNLHARRASYALIPNLIRELGLPKLNGLLLDLGFSSIQIDDATRGMSFSRTGPLDMRYDRSGGATAADVVNGLPEAELARIVFEYGDERHSRRIAKAIVETRRKRKITTTDELTRIIELILGGVGRVHPATKTFQALRIYVNDELGELGKILGSLGDIMAPGGTVAIISFHSLEDRAVKESFRALAQGGSATLVTKKPVAPGDEEVSVNPRSRSAKLRAITFS